MNAWEDSVAVIPSRGMTVVGGSGPDLVAYVYIGMMLTADWDPQEEAKNSDESLMLPRFVEDAEALERRAGNLIDVHEVMGL